MSARRGDNKVWRGLAPHHSITSSARRRNNSEIVRPSAFAHDKDNVVGLVRSRGLEPPRVAPLAPQASASTNSATTADGMNAGRGPRVEKALDVTNQLPGNKGHDPRASAWRRLDIDRCRLQGNSMRPASSGFHVRRSPESDPLRYFAAATGSTERRSLSSGYNHVVVSARDDLTVGLDPAPGSPRWSGGSARGGALRGCAGGHGRARHRHRRAARRPSWSGCSSIRRSTPPAPAPNPGS